MLFKKDSKKIAIDTSGKGLKEVLEGEGEAYEEELGNKLKSRESVVFEISDMVRGKCVFVSIRDIIDTVQAIKEYAKLHPDRYRIIECESRFDLKCPISDVTMKIVLSEQIVAELQLTLQTNAAAYHFAHVVYEISRSKIFSQVKMVDNMFL